VNNTEVMTACENVCRDFSWLADGLPIAANLATVLAFLLACFALNNWRKQARHAKLSELAVIIITRARTIRQNTEFASSYSSDIDNDLLLGKQIAELNYGFIRRGVAAKSESEEAAYVLELMDALDHSSEQAFKTLIESFLKIQAAFDLISSVDPLDPRLSDQSKTFIEQNIKIVLHKDTSACETIAQTTQKLEETLAPLVTFGAN